MTSPLRELYDSVTAANGWSTRDVERRVVAQSQGTSKLSRARINQIVNAEPLTSITAEAIHSLAAGLGVSPARVALAAVQSMGFRVADDAITPAEAIRRDVGLTEHTKRALLSILQAEGRRFG